MLIAYIIIAFVFAAFLHGIPGASLRSDLLCGILWPWYLPAQLGRMYSIAVRRR